MLDPDEIMKATDERLLDEVNIGIIDSKLVTWEEIKKACARDQGILSIVPLVDVCNLEKQVISLYRFMYDPATGVKVPWDKYAELAVRLDADIAAKRAEARAEARRREQEARRLRAEENYMGRTWMDASSMYGGPSLKWMDAYARNHDLMYKLYP